MTLILTTHRAVVFYAYYIEDRVDASLQETVAKTTTTWHVSGGSTRMRWRWQHVDYNNWRTKI